jgi:UDP-N-acetylmuramyl pentapeptide phosphotransferase/UDP-N-acetylglucosamine-1-phosphate transferase
MNIAVVRISVPPLDFLLSYAIVSGVVTVLAVAALANAVNIIDGFNGPTNRFHPRLLMLDLPQQ